MSTARQAVDSKVAQRLRLRRLVVVDADAARAEAFALALQRSGAVAVAASPGNREHSVVHALDADVMLVNEDEAEPCRPLVLALRLHPRTRWATVLPISFGALWPDDAAQPDIAAIAEEVNRLVTSMMELAVRAKGRLPYETALEPLGPSRILRVLGNTGRSLRIAVSDDRIRAVLELDERRVGGVRASIAGSHRSLSDAEALAAVLAMSCGHVRIDERGETTLASWNVPMSSALGAAAAIGWSAAATDGATLAQTASGVRPAVSARFAAQQRANAAEAVPNLQPTVPAITLSEVFAEAVVMDLLTDADTDAVTVMDINADVHAKAGTAQDPSPVVDPATELIFDEPTITLVTSEPSASMRARERRSRAPVLALILALVAAGALYVRSPMLRAAWADALASLVASSVRPPPDRKPQQPAGAGATVVAISEPKVASEPEAASEPVPADDARATQTAEQLEPTQGELEQAQQFTKRGHRYLREGRNATAETAYLKALELAPNHVPALKPLIRIQIEDGNAAEAHRWAEQLAALEPDNAISQLLLGDARALSGEDELATEAWQRSSALGSETARKRLAQH